MRGTLARAIGWAAWLAPLSLLAGQAPQPTRADLARIEQIPAGGSSAAPAAVKRAEPDTAAGDDTPAPAAPGGADPALVPASPPLALAVPLLAPGVTVLQSGSGNVASITQDGPALADGAASARIEQSGTDNQAVLLQDGAGSQALQIQQGTQNRLSLEQHGAAAGVVQIQIGSGLEQHVQQSGGWGGAAAPAVTITQTR